MVNDPFAAARQREFGRATAPAEVTRIQIAPHRLLPGTRYRIIRWLGEGGMGVVYEAEHVDIGRRVAIKLIRQEYCSNPSALQQFRQEARASARIGSDAILEVYDFVELPDGRLMIAMELLKGQDLFRAISDAGEPFDAARTIGILRQCCRALEAAHDVGIVHRDIKPENIFLVDGKERPDKVKLVDFGIAVVLSGDETRRNLGGTPHYFAPEAITSSVVAPSVDQYAIGCVAYEMLTGKVPFDFPSVQEIIDAHCQAQPVPPSSLRTSIPRALELVVLRLLSKDPEDRYASMADLEAALCEAQIEAGVVTAWDDLPLPEVEPERRDHLLRNMPEPEREFMARRRWPVFIGLMALLSLGGLVATSQRSSDLEHAVAPSRVDELVARARAAGARAYYVYPPADAPGEPTAYRLLKELEELDEQIHPGAVEHAEALRAEFSETLNRLGNQYWNATGGKVFAQAYYRQALLFDPDIEPALHREAVSDEELKRLEARVLLAEFSRLELLEAEPLAILAESDDARRAERYADYVRRRDAHLRKFDAQLVETAHIDVSSTKGGRSASQRSRTEVQDAPAGEERAEPTGDGEGESEPEADERDRRIDRPKAREIAEEGRAALSAGDEARAELLFERALGLHPTQSIALAGLRDLHFDAGDYGRAVRYAERVVRARPRTAEHRLRLGDAYFKVSRYDEAQREYAEALELGDDRARWRLDKARARTAP